MRELANKKAGEHSTTFSFSMVFALILVIAAFVIWVGGFSGLAKGISEAQEKGFCLGLLKSRGAVNKVQIIPIGDPWLGPAITGTSAFYVSPACGYMYPSPCATVLDCQNRTLTNLQYCRNMQKNEPDTPRPCLTDLEINATVTTELCKDTICGPGPDCGTTGVPKDIITYDKCPQKGASLTIRYDKSNIIVECQGGCN